MISLDKDQTKKFEELVKPVMEFLSQGTIFHPHISIIITSTNAEIVEGIQNFVTHEFLEEAGDMTNEKLLHLKMICNKAKPFYENDPSLDTERDKERAAINGELFELAYNHLPQLIDELLKYRQLNTDM